MILFTHFKIILLQCFQFLVRVCSQPAKTNPTQPTGLGWFLGLSGLGWITKKVLIVGRVGFGS